MKKTLPLLTIAMLSIFLYLNGKSAFSKEYKPAIVRVAVIKDTDYITLAVKGRYKILSLYTQDLLDEGKNLKKTEIVPTISGLLVGKTPFKIFGIKVEPTRDASIFINNRRFRGVIDIIRTQDLKLLVVNHVDVERYLYGVLYHEVSPRWTMEALKVQAVTSRTFALYQSHVRKEKDYDLTADIYSQVYGGRTSEKWRTTRAVNLTQGKVLTFEGRLFPSYYHATCGGHTEDASLLWDIDLKPLKGVKCKYCEESPHYRWRRRILLGEIEERLNKNDYNIKGISSISIENRDKSGRITNLVLRGKGSKIRLPANRFRLIVGPNIIRSVNFEVTLSRDAAHFEGIGWGHGVGLCQWGSYLMSKKGYKADQILKHYYPGLEIKEYPLPPTKWKW